MKKIINGKKYDTDTATCIGFRDNGYNAEDFNHQEELLYQKKTGEFFIYGIGGANSEYSKVWGSNSRCGGSKIIPLSTEEAKEWAQELCSVEKYEELFGEVEE